MKKQVFEHLLGGAQAGHLSRDATIGLNSLSRRMTEQAAEDELFETALRRADDSELRKLARFRLDSASSKHLD